MVCNRRRDLTIIQEPAGRLIWFPAYLQIKGYWSNQFILIKHWGCCNLLLVPALVMVSGGKPYLICQPCWWLPAARFSFGCIPFPRLHLCYDAESRLHSAIALTIPTGMSCSQLIATVLPIAAGISSFQHTCNDSIATQHRRIASVRLSHVPQDVWSTWSLISEHSAYRHQPPATQYFSQ